MRARYPMLALALMVAAANPAWADVATLELSAETVLPGGQQEITVHFKRADTYDVYLILTGPGKRFTCLQPDGAFAPRRKVVPYLRGLRVRKAGKLMLHAWRVTELNPSRYRWSVVLVRTGKNMLEEKHRLGLDTRRFTVKKRDEEAAVYTELAEGGKGGRAPGRAEGATFSLTAARRSGGERRVRRAEKLGAAGAVKDRAAAAPAAEAEEATEAGALDKEAKREITRAPAAKPHGEARKKAPADETDAALQQAKALTAGESDDNKEFELFLDFLKKRNRPQVMAMDVSQRRFITVLDASGRHVPNADVEVLLAGKLVYAGRTYANGQTLFFPSAVPDVEGKQTLRVNVRKGLLEAQYQFEVEIVKDEKLTNRFDPKSLPTPKPPVDMPHPVIPLYRGGLEDKDRRAVAGAAKRAAAVNAAQAPTAGNLDWLEDSGDDSGEAEEPAEPIVREPAAQPEGDWVLRLPAAVQAVQPHVDLVFQIDTTGSMRDEIRSVQATLDSVAARIDAMDPRPLVRWGLVLYGDKGDAYTVRRYPFTPDVKQFRKWIENAQMTGGGDMPEAALEGLNASVSEMAWHTGDAIRLIFLIADAPPHLDYGRPYTYLDKMKEAIAKGIKICPTAASGLNKQGEYIFRQWAQATLARFLFITYGAGTPAGGPAGKTPHEVKQPKKKNDLDDIIVKVVGEELKDWTTPGFYAHGANEQVRTLALPEEEAMLF